MVEPPANTDSGATLAAPVITIDGPSGAGKGTVAMRLAESTGFHLLDSGAVYRAAAIKALHNNVDLSSEAAVVACIQSMNARFETGGGTEVRVIVDDQDVTSELRSEATASAASTLAVLPAVRLALLQAQRDFCQPPGLVADGRDMGTVVFPDAILKVYLTASVRERAVRRHKQLNEKGIIVTLESLLQELEVRDKRDTTRKTAPLVPAKDALVIDSTGIKAEVVLAQISSAFHERIRENA